ncbi:MAG TPA: peroxidase family protein [Tepidisphaeraceae bacterium]|nr:peroxidase family protein [Tepidisphaeraceae bacterium]
MPAPHDRFEQLEQRTMMSASVSSAIESYDGTANNLLHPDWGSINQALLRIAKAAYADGLSMPAGANLASARAISNAVNAQGDVDILNTSHLSAFAYEWGQFIDHDIDLTSDGTTGESFNIAVPQSDPYFDPNGSGTAVIPLTRSEYVAGTGVTSPRENPNDITAFIDGSMVYGSTESRALALRTLVGGLMKTSSGNLLPLNTMGLDNATAGGDPTTYFAAGDVRANENIELTSLQTLFVREHNRLATKIAQQNPTWTDEQIFQKARSLVIGEIQAITYNEFLPALLGNGAIRNYTGYKAKVNPGITNEFSTAAFRFGHSMVGNDVEFLDNNGEDVHDDVSFAQAFFNPALLQETGIDPILKYLASDNSQQLDVKIVDPLRNFLFGPPGSGGLDLASLNIQRGRDHGLADYNSTRAALSLPKVTSFAQITSDPELQQKLQSVYGDVNNIDLWVGGLAEDHVRGSNLGPTFQRIVADQFTRLRDGDRFWYQRSLSGADLRMVENTSLADVISRNTTTTNLQDNVFVFNTTISGKVFADLNGDGRQQFLEAGLPGQSVNLLDADGNVVQTATTLLNGNYKFEGVQLGEYQVQVQLAAGWKLTTVLPAGITVTRGMNFDNISFGEQSAKQQPPNNPWHDPFPRNLGDLIHRIFN